MSTEPKPRRKRGPSEKVGVYLGVEVYRQLHRCQALLCDGDPTASLPSAGETVRVAIRRLLLVLLGERADLGNPADPMIREYLDLLDAYDVWPGQPTDPRERLGERRDASGRKTSRQTKLKGGLE